MTRRRSTRVFERIRGSVARRGLRGSLRLAWRKGGDACVRLATGRTRYERWLASLPQAPPLAPELRPPLLSVLLPTCEPEPRWLARAVESVLSQSYPHFELCVVDDASDQLDVGAWLRDRYPGEERLRIRRLERRAGISAATNAALALAGGGHFALLDHDDELAPGALQEIAVAISEYDPDLLYSDEDKIDTRGGLRDPAFKPDFSPDWFLSCNFVSHLGVYRTALARELGGFRSELDGSQDYDLALRFMESGARIHHVARVLYHWRMLPGSTADPWADAKPWAYDAARRALEAHLTREGVEAEVLDGAGRGFYRVRRSAPREVRAGIVVYGEGGGAAFEVEGCAIQRVPAPATAEALNAAAESMSAELLVFVDAGLVPSRSDWVTVLAAHALRPEVGCVGTRVVAPRRRVLHAGVVLGGPQGVRGERLALYGSEPGPMGASGAVRNASAVSGGCLAIASRHFGALAGFDTGFGSSLFDVDLCLRAAERGLRTVYEPHAEMRSARARLATPAAPDVARLLELWAPRIEAGDPYYNPAFGGEGPLYEARMRPHDSLGPLGKL